MRGGEIGGKVRKRKGNSKRPELSPEPTNEQYSSQRERRGVYEREIVRTERRERERERKEWWRFEAVID